MTKEQTAVFSGTFADAANKMSGHILVVYPPGGQMQNYISGGSVTVSRIKHVSNQSFLYLNICNFTL